MPMSSN